MGVGRPNDRRCRRSGLLRQTKPISGSWSDCTNKANSAGRVGGRHRGERRGRSCETNPISQSWRAAKCPPFRYSIILPFPSDADCAQRTRLGSAWPGSGPRRAKDAKQTQSGAHRTVRANPSSASRQGGRGSSRRRALCRGRPSWSRACGRSRSGRSPRRTGRPGPAGRSGSRSRPGCRA